MTAVAQKQIAAKALALPIKARARLASQLLKSLDEPVEKLSRKEWNGAWKVELEKRIADIESGRVKCVPYAEVRKRLDRILGRA